MSDEITSAPGGDPTGTPSHVPAPSGTPAAPTATPSAPSAPTTGAPEGYVPSYRLREAREAALRQAQTEYGQRETQARAEMERYKQQLHALVGVQAPPDPGVQQVRSQFGELYPGLTKLEERANDLMGLIERAGDMESQNNHYWQAYGRQTMDRLFDHAAQSLGGPLSDEGKRALHASFTGFVQSSPELTARYANDPTIVNDFWKDFTSNFIDPVRRAASAQVIGRATASLPQDTPGGIPRPAPAAPPGNLDERANQAWALYQQNKKV